MNNKISKMSKEQKEKQKEETIKRADEYISKSLSDANNLKLPFPTKTWMGKDLKRHKIRITNNKFNELYLTNLATYFEGADLQFNIIEINKIAKRLSAKNRELLSDKIKKSIDEAKVDAHQVTVYGIIIKGDHYSWPPVEFDFYAPASMSLTRIQSMVKDVLPKGARFVNHLAPSGQEYAMTVMFAGRSLKVAKNFILDPDNLEKFIDKNIHGIHYQLHETHHTYNENQVVRSGHIKPLYESEWRNEYGDE